MPLERLIAASGFNWLPLTFSRAHIRRERAKSPRERGIKEKKRKMKMERAVRVASARDCKTGVVAWRVNSLFFRDTSEKGKGRFRVIERRLKIRMLKITRYACNDLITLCVQKLWWNIGALDTAVTYISQLPRLLPSASADFRIYTLGKVSWEIFVTSRGAQFLGFPHHFSFLFFLFGALRALSSIVISFGFIGGISPIFSPVFTDDSVVTFWLESESYLADFC